MKTIRCQDRTKNGKYVVLVLFIYAAKKTSYHLCDISQRNAYIFLYFTKLISYIYIYIYIYIDIYIYIYNCGINRNYVL